MKYWNKDKDVRRRCWTKIEIDHAEHRYNDMKRWCQLQPSTGKFYKYYGSNTWWFENSKDATWFAMRWL